MTPPLIVTERPQSWDRIVGQDRAVRILRGMFGQQRSRPKGLIFAGSTGVGKTTTARIAAKHFMCTHDVPGCGECPSCRTFDLEPAHHPDFKSVDAASTSGVEAARQIIDLSTELPSLGARRVVIVDEAHRLSREAWDVYLAPLEDRDSRCVFLFCPTEPSRIPVTIRGRCCHLPFPKVSAESMVGLLVAICSRNGIEFEMDGIRSIARSAQGHVRDAVHLVDTVASLGKVTREAVISMADLTLSDTALNVWIHLAAGRTKEAYADLDAMARGFGAAKAIDEMFAVFGRALVGSDPDTTEGEARRYEAIRARFCDVPAVTGTLLRWSTPERVPADALVLFGHELAQHVVLPDQVAPRTTALPSRDVRPTPPEPVANPSTPERRTLTPEQVAERMGGTLVIH